MDNLCGRARRAWHESTLCWASSGRACRPVAMTFEMCGRLGRGSSVVLGSSAWARHSDVAGRARRGCEPGLGHVLAGWAGCDTCGRPWAGHERAGRAGVTRAAGNWRAYGVAPGSILSPGRRGACGAVATMIVGATKRVRGAGRQGPITSRARILLGERAYTAERARGEYTRAWRAARVLRVASEPGGEPAPLGPAYGVPRRYWGSSGRRYKIN